MRVTRRGVLAIAGSALSAPAIASDGLSEPPTVNLEAGDLTIGLGKSRWTLSPQAFSGIPSVPLPTLSLKTEFTQPNDTPRWTASLSDAVLPGTTIRFDLSLLIGHDDVANYWYVTATLNGRVSRKLHLPDFLGAEAVFEFARRGYVDDRTGECGSGRTRTRQHRGSDHGRSNSERDSRGIGHHHPRRTWIPVRSSRYHA